MHVIMRPGRTIGLCWNVGTWIMEGTQLIALSTGCPSMKNHDGFWALIIFPQPRSWHKLWMTSCIRWKIGDRKEILITGSLSSVQSHLTLWDPVDCSTPGFAALTNSRSLLKFMSIESVMPSKHLILCRTFASCLQHFPESGSFPVSQFFTSGGQSTGASASASVLPMNIQDRFPLGLSPLISLLSKGFSRVFSNTPVQKH